ncbi:MAG: hypothetical protein HOE80_03285 [Candidatus Magasanikbacteria bacterium]|jgi:hypothetical protein|nr:hypothetical protein [Candidatus Magasanikbacteria bacterium]MBT4071720.1 hypothetical protein [Candidatus Magasanikbacteria bacterium]
MSLDIDNFEEVRVKAEDFYKGLSQVYCPYLKDKISFNSSGLRHIKFKRQRQSRSRQDQYMRFKLLHLAPKVISASATLQGILESNNFERVRVNSKTQNIMKFVTYYEFIAVIDSIRVKVILKQIEDGECFFWSIIPYWGVDKEHRRKKLHSGYPAND